MLNLFYANLSVNKQILLKTSAIQDKCFRLNSKRDSNIFLGYLAVPGLNKIINSLLVQECQPRHIELISIFVSHHIDPLILNL